MQALSESPSGVSLEVGLTRESQGEIPSKSIMCRIGSLPVRPGSNRGQSENRPMRYSITLDDHLGPLARFGPGTIFPAAALRHQQSQSYPKSATCRAHFISRWSTVRNDALQTHLVRSGLALGVL